MEWVYLSGSQTRNHRDVIVSRHILFYFQIISDEHPFGKSATLGVPPNYVSYIRKQCENLYMKAHVVYEDLQTCVTN